MTLQGADVVGHDSGENACSGKGFAEWLLGVFGLRMGIGGLTSVDVLGTDTIDLTVLQLLGEISTGGDADVTTCDDVLAVLRLDESQKAGQFLSSTGLLLTGDLLHSSSLQCTGEGTVSVVVFGAVDVTTRLG